MRASSASVLLVAAGMVWGTGACVAPTFRPVSPRRVEADGETVEIVRADLRRFVVDVDVGGGTSPAHPDGAWVWAVGAADGAPCARRLAARSLEAIASAGPERAFAAQFDRALLDPLAGPSNLEVRLVGAGRAARCVSVPLSGPQPELAWRLEPWGENLPFAGRALTFWFPVGASRYSGGADLVLLRLGRWWGPVRLGAGVGLGSTCCGHHDPNAAFAIPMAVGAELFPLVGRRVALGLGASYQVRPSWFVNDGSRGFEWVHGPVGSVEVAYLPRPLRGFLEGPRSGTVALSFSVGRWLPEGGGTVLGASLSFN